MNRILNFKEKENDFLNKRGNKEKMQQKLNLGILDEKKEFIISSKLKRITKFHYPKI